MHGRSELLLGKAAIEKLKQSSVAVFGLGGVGSFAAEALARSGIGTMALVDGDKVAETNLNRQLFALRSTIGMAKAEAAKFRLSDINPDIELQVLPFFYTQETADKINLGAYDYVVDAIDTVTSKLLLIEKAKQAGVPIISSMGAGNKLDASCFEVKDIYSTKMCPLAKVMRKELKKRGIEALKVVCSEEPPRKTEGRVTGSVAFVPPVAGLIMAGEVVKDLTKDLRSDDN